MLGSIGYAGKRGLLSYMEAPHPYLRICLGCTTRELGISGLGRVYCRGRTSRARVAMLEPHGCGGAS